MKSTMDKVRLVALLFLGTCLGHVAGQHDGAIVFNNTEVTSFGQHNEVTTHRDRTMKSTSLNEQGEQLTEIDDMNIPSSSPPSMHLRRGWRAHERVSQHDNIANTTQRMPRYPQDVIAPNIDNDTEFWRQISEAYTEYCGFFCEVVNGLLEGTKTYRLNTQRARDRRCSQCFCDEACLVYGDCCPDVYYRTGQRPGESPAAKCLQCLFISPRPHIDEDAILMVSKCPDEYPDQYIAERCQSWNPHWNFARPVTGSKSLLVFKNQYCAQCHSETSYEPWSTYLIYEPADYEEHWKNYETPEEIYVEALFRGHPRIVFESSSGRTRACVTTGVSSCNAIHPEQTSLYAGVEKACLAFSAPVDPPFSSSKYRNPFCYLCNSFGTWDQLLDEKYPPTTPPPDIVGPGSIVNPPGLTRLIDFGEQETGRARKGEPRHFADPVTSTCNERDFFDVYTNSCRPVLCTAAKEPPVNISTDSKCTVSQTHNGDVYGYTFCLRANLTESELTGAREALDPEYLQNTLQWMVSRFGLTLYSLDMYRSEKALAEVARCKNTCGTEDRDQRTETRDQASEQTADSEPLLVILPMLPLSAADRDYTDESLLSDLDSVVVALANNLTMPGLRSSAICQSFKDEEQFKVFPPPQFPGNLSRGSAVSSSGSELHLKKPASGTFAGQVYVNRLLTCPAVVLFEHEYTLSTQPEELILERDGKVVVFPDFQVSWSDVWVCLDQLLQPPSANNSFTRLPEGVLPTLEIVSLTCYGTSLFFLLLSFVIYCLLPELRHIAGINNMVLIFSLFWAQVLLLVAIYGDVRGLGWVCEAVGCAMHWLWLCVVFAQNTCTFHMFYTLSFPLRSHAANTKVRHMATRYMAYVLTTASLLVVAVVIWQVLVEGHSGYGGNDCFIRHTEVRIAMFIAPLGFSIVVNLAMYFFTVWRLSSLSGLVSPRPKRKSLILYTKLSVFTGLTWVAAFLASAFDSLLLSYVFEVLQGCQGLFIFLAFLCSKTVFTKLNPCRPSEPSAGGTTGSARVNNSPNNSTGVYCGCEWVKSVYKGGQDPNSSASLAPPTQSTSVADKPRSDVETSLLNRL